MQRRADRVVAATSPIYAQAQDGGIEGVGTGIFFRYQECHFVLSAGHVLSRSRNELLLIGSDHLIPLNGRFFTSPSNDVDLGFVPLTEEQRAECRGAVFLTTDDVDRPDEGGDRLRYYVPGFRAVDNEPDGTPPTNVISIGSAYLAHAAPANTYQTLGLSPNTHLVLNFNREKLYSSRTITEEEPEPQGLSGSGVWQFRQSPASDKLVAIVIEQSDTHRVLISTRFGPLLDALAAHVAGALT